VLVLDFFGRRKRADCQQRSKIENEEDEDDWRGAYTALYTYRCLQRPGSRKRLPSREIEDEDEFDYD
jgi:CO/xanthine dehydrogenase Mo-binding subunit